MLDLLLFDIDGTLYNPASGLVARVDELMNRFLQDRLHLSWEDANKIRIAYTAEFGSLARGIALRHGLDPGELYAECVDSVNPADHLQPDPAVREVLLALPQRKAVFSNASHLYTERVLAALSVSDQFERLLTIEWGDYRGKPTPELYRDAERELGVAGQQVALIDDAPGNLVPAHALGWVTVLMDRGRRDDHYSGGIDFTIDGLSALAAVLAA